MLESRQPLHVNISSLTIVKVVLVGIGLVLLWLVRDVLAMIFVAWVLSMALHPWVNWLQRHHIPRALGILSVYVLAFAIFTTILILLVPPVTEELTSIAQNFPTYYAPIQQALDSVRQTGESIGIIDTLRETLNSTVQGVSQLSSGIYDAVSSIFTGIITLVGILVIAFYMTSEEDGIKKFVQSISPINYQPYILHKLNQVQHRLSNWLWGQFVLMIFVGTLTGLALWILGVKYALVLGILAGLLEFIPVIGPTLAAVPAIFFAFTDFAHTPYKPFIVLVMFIIIQQVENQLLVPRVMKRAVGLNPIIIIISLLVGAKLGGFIGVVLSVPCVAIIDVFLSDFLQKKQEEQNKLEA